MTLEQHWKAIPTCHVGGLTEIGFSDDEAYVLVISHDGRGVFATNTGEKVARDRAGPTDESPWFDEEKHTVQGIGPFVGLRGQPLDVRVVGLWGGTLVDRTPDGWRVESRIPRGLFKRREEIIVLTKEPEGLEWVIDRPVTEVRALGFSPSGKYLAVATSSDLTLFRRA